MWDQDELLSDFLKSLLPVLAAASKMCYFCIYVFKKKFAKIAKKPQTKPKHNNLNTTSPNPPKKQTKKPPTKPRKKQLSFYSNYSMD